MVVPLGRLGRSMSGDALSIFQAAAIQDEVGDAGGSAGVVADLGRIVRIPILPDGSAGEVEILFEAPELLLGIADFVVDDDGDLYAISGFQSKVWKIDVDGGYVVTTLADHSSSVQVDTPGQIVSGYGGLLFTNNAFVVNDEKGPPRPGLTRIGHADTVAQVGAMSH